MTTRSPFNVLVIPYRRSHADCEFAVLHRAGEPMWQFITGGGELNETPLEAARREAREEAEVGEGLEWLGLEQVAAAVAMVKVGAGWARPIRS